MSWRSALVVSGVVFTAAESFAQSTPTLEQLLDRMGEYLLEYETQLSSVVAQERFEQRISRTATLTTLESEVAFIRLPGGLEWLGFRDIRRVNFNPVKRTGPSITEVLTSSDGDIQKAQTIAQESARHNLGLPRTINVPTAPLEIIHPRNRSAHVYTLDGTDRVRGVSTMIVGFTETARPTLVREPDGTYLVSSGRMWVEPKSGSVRRVEWTFHTERGSGEGVATYKNFRRFGTSARIVPQQR